MAAFAAVAERLPVNIVPLVAIDATRIQHGNLLSRLIMACHAIQFSMGAIENEVSPLVVLEIPDAPVARGVARRTIRPQPALVYILLAMTGSTFPARILELRTGMAGLALDRQMPAGQRKIRTAMVEVSCLPRHFGMATLAFTSFLAGMAVILSVARDALRGKFLAKRSVEVAGLAGDRGVFSPQRITRIAIMVEGGFLPGGFQMTGLAGCAEAAFVRVLLRMAAVAIFRRLVHVQLAGVTCFAFNFRVRLAQPKTRFPLVLELERLPGRLAMAALALFREPAFVHIVLQVAPHALAGWCILEGLTLVARHAARFPVRTEKRKAGPAMIKVGALPASVVVAFRAFRSQSVFVDIIPLVATDTLDGGILETLVAVTIRAFDHRMPA